MRHLVSFDLSTASNFQRLATNDTHHYVDAHRIISHAAPAVADASHLLALFTEVGKNIDELAEGIAHIESSNAPRLFSRPILDGKPRRLHAFEDRVQIVDFYRQIGCRCIGSAFGHETDLDGHLLPRRSEEHTSELQSLRHLVCRLLLEKKK